MFFQLTPRVRGFSDADYTKYLDLLNLEYSSLQFFYRLVSYLLILIIFCQRRIGENPTTSGIGLFPRDVKNLMAKYFMLVLDGCRFNKFTETIFSPKLDKLFSEIK